MTLGHRLAVLNGGYVEQLGTPIEIYEKPASVFVAGFIGSPSMNLMSATIDSTGGLAILSGGSEVKLQNKVSDHAGKTITFGIRPEHIATESDTDTAINLTVGIVEKLGADTLIHGVMDDGVNMVVRLDGIRDFEAGQKLQLSFPPEMIHLFDGNSGRRIEQ